MYVFVFFVVDSSSPFNRKWRLGASPVGSDGCPSLEGGDELNKHIDVPGFVFSSMSMSILSFVAHVTKNDGSNLDPALDTVEAEFDTRTFCPRLLDILNTW